MKSTSASLWLAIAALVTISFSPCQAQTSVDSVTTTTATTTAPPDAVTTKKSRFKKQRPKKARRWGKHHVSGKNLSGGVAKKKRWRKGKTYKPYTSAQQKRLDKLDTALSNPKRYKKMPELSTPGGANSTQAAPGL